MTGVARPRVVVLEDAEAVARHAADAVAGAIDAARRERRELHVALAGGTTFERAYELLAQIEGSWAHVHLWLGDERCVPEDDEEANVRMVRASLLTGERDGPAVLHAVPSPEIPEDAAWLYGRELLAHMPDAVFDVVLLGMGPDGHTCSLFPGHPVLDVREAPVAPVRGAPKPPPERVTLTLPVLRAARMTLLLATGEGKRDALARALAGDTAIPLARLLGGLDEVACDRAAAPEHVARGVVDPAD
jgi:6-phosphogluconolactonase